MYFHPKALVESDQIGAGTHIWAFAHVLSGAVIGKDCNICDGVFIEGNTSIGDRVTIKCGVQIWSGVRLEDDVFVGPNATFTNDAFPRSKDYSKPISETRVCKGASIGANATILPEVTIGRYAMVGAGSVVTKSVPPFAMVVGNPARIVGYTHTAKPADSNSLPSPSSSPKPGVTRLGVGNAALHRFNFVEDLRGNLTASDFEKELPFAPKRHFLVFGVPGQEVRGEHAHHTCHQLLIAVHGSLAVVVDDGTQRREIVLDHPSLGLYLPPLTWGIQYKYTAEAVLLVFASLPYNPQDYIRDYDTFLGVLAQRAAGT
jgi:UDP-2-acetamido-3-amino-2,3-dideoxy-glucuronate N-acetyltransferase